MNSAQPAPLVVVADPIHAQGLAALESWARVLYAPDRLELASLGADAEGLVVRAPIDTETLAAMPKLRAIVRCGAGVDGIPQAYAASRNITVSNTPGANADAVAEYVFAALLQANRGLAAYASALRSGDWQRRIQAREQTLDLHGRRLGIVGMGEIGQRVARIGHFGFGMQVRAAVTTPRPLPEHVRPMAINTLCEESDALVLCCSLTDQTRGLIGERQLRSLPAHAVLVNVARAAVIEESALLAFAADPDRTVALMLDVHYTSPPAVDSPLHHAHLCWQTPHLAGLTADAERSMGLGTSAMLKRLLGKPLLAAAT